LAFSLGAMQGTKPARALAALAFRDAGDPWMRMAILSSVSACTCEVFHRLADNAGFRSSPNGHALLTALAAQTGAAERADDLAAVLKELDGSLAADKRLSGDIVMALLSRASAASQVQLRAAGGGHAQAILAGILTLRISGDRERGKAVFKEQCSTCHRLEGVGRQVGADLAAIRDRGIDSVLLNILDPNRDVMPQYQSYVLATTSGRVVTGMIADETANSVTIRKPDGGDETVPRHQIEELRSTGLSFMPEGLDKQIDVPAMADLLAYISSVKSP
jgi:putative heme-binding domain-containing protein